MEALQHLLKNNYLPGGWSNPEIYSDQLILDSVKFQMIGFSSVSPNGKLVTGSAASLQNSKNSPGIRAYFELIERACLVSFFEKPKPSVYSRNHTGKTNSLNWEQVFPKSSEPDSWNYSLSNGVAAHTQLHHAEMNAAMELWERDQILRAWYSQQTPIRLPQLEARIDTSISERYSMKAFLLTSPDLASSIPHVVGVFGFPKDSAYPFHYGFGCDLDLSKAMDKSLQESLQRMCFLWGETSADLTLKFSPTADFHQDYYLRPEGIASIRNWLEGRRQSHSKLEICLKYSNFLENFEFVDVTPSSLKGRIHIIKAISDQLFQLTFGRMNPNIPHCSEDLRIHPIA